MFNSKSLCLMTTKQMMLNLAERINELANFYDVLDAVKDSIGELNDKLYDATTTLETAMEDIDSVMQKFNEENDE